MDNNDMVNVKDVKATITFGLDCFNTGYRKGVRDGLVLAAFWSGCAYVGYKIGYAIAPVVYNFIDKIKSKKEA